MFDVKVSLTLKSVDNSRGWLGVVFRKKDDFNYYSLDVSKNWIRFRKMIHGQQTIFA